MNYRCACFFAIAVLTAVTVTSPLPARPPETRTGNSDQKPWSIVLVAEEEPGEPMIVTGTVYGPDGKRPLEDVEVHVYHTDARGYYSKDGKDESQHRINGTIVTNAEGRYEYRTIKPASYPDSRVPSHVHYKVSAPGYRMQGFALEFKGDPHISEQQYAREARKGKFARIKPLEKGRDGILRCELNIKMQPRSN